MDGPVDPDFDEPLFDKFEKGYFVGHVVELNRLSPVDLAQRTPGLDWFVVFTFNLIVPGFIGMVMTDVGGKVGMLMGVLIVYAAGILVCNITPETRCTIVRGGWVVACFQFFPLPQLVAGAAGLCIAELRSGADYSALNMPRGLIATFITGGLLVVFAGVFGLFLRLLGRLIQRRGSVPAFTASCRGSSA